ncbi:extracellular solute-binding protein family 1 [Pseudarthrobacter chlorophenolicus A6]|uniref:Extracellular solute-binding protein family 1 n=1 Tax=Pseudarthrobacter chlorophenolicus (strain ATCC 700700 / DSM 12829 / CIP 107037 / JCM 12360 / KCTC 9906 / NCIMB 13794 / A6) TaxID=452863 RepID=B8HA14_PSECP|nr:ABC transporter substrate-binding protein [Pseudarthrobacter chlorophenolicus]ACL38398.1 extracellular solute-binding protein family 1 [Pseudarthrobacter chlorophenolicus A6]SDQ49566.1 cellobiose-binding protein [Pseudarthrobacter chlorophenolicus]
MKNPSKFSVLSAAAACLAVSLTACGSSSPGKSDVNGATGSEAVTLTVGTFNEFGYEALFKEYEAQNPNVTIQHKKAATTNEARDNLTTRLAAGSGLSDIEAVEVDWLPELLQYPDRFADLADPAVEGRWLDWKAQAATTADGKLLGYGTDSGPEAVCYNSELLRKAGLPTERGEVAKMLGTSWDSYFDAGKKFKAANPGSAWFDSAGAIYQGMSNQLEKVYEEEDGSVIATENQQVKDTYKQVLKASTEDGLSAHLKQWSDDWASGFQTGAFATTLCPGWMLGVIEGNAAGVTGWDVANVFPGGGGNWGGSYLTVPTQGAHQAEAKKLAAWLTAPEQQIKAFTAKGTFPSQKEALESSELLGQTSKFFDGAPTGEIFAERAKAVDVTPFKGTKYFAINDAMQQALARVDVDKSDDAASSWDKFVTAVKSL